jgi:hypothetical protein
MASINDYIRGLQADYAKNNIYSQLGSGLLGADVNIKGGSPWTNLATNFVKGLLGGGLNEYGQVQNQEYNTGLRSVLEDTLTGSPIRAVDGVSEGELSNAANMMSMFKTATDQDIANSGLLKKSEGKGSMLGQLEAQSEAFGGLDSLTNPANPNAKQIQEEVKASETKKQSFDFIDNAYEEAKKLVGLGAAVPTQIGGSRDALTGLGDSLVIQIDNAVGRELNSDVRQRLLNLAPKWYDNAEQLDQKKGALKALLDSLSAPTPTLDRLGMSPKVEAPKSDAPITGTITRTLKDGTKVNVRPLGNGKYEVVQ